MSYISEFVPRLEAPDGTEKWWSTSYSPCLACARGTTLPNCVGYSWGRFAEVMQDYPHGLPDCNAGQSYWDACPSSFEKSTDPSKPRLGAIMVLGPQHVANVEEIEYDSNGNVVTVTTSESGYGHSWDTRFWTEKRTFPDYSSNGRYYFIGFIYNPAVGPNTKGVQGFGSINHPALKFVQEAESHAGAGGHDWVKSMTNIKNQPWCAATCCAVAKACGYAGVIMPGDDYDAPHFARQVVERYGGTRINGPMSGDTNATPEPGDLVVYQNKGDPYWEGYHIGIVRSCDGDVVHTVEGNTGHSEYKFKEKNKHGSDIGWYARPDWSKVGGTASYGYTSTVYTRKDLYETENDRADASIREVCFMTEACKPSISLTSVKLSAINYTSMLQVIVRLLGGVVEQTQVGYAISGSPDNIDGLPPVPREIVQFLKNKGLNTAAAVGIIANIEAESSFNTAAVGDGGTSFGICQWHNARGVAMKQLCGGGSKWKTDLSGQLQYLWVELNTSEYLGLLNRLQEVPNTVEGAKRAVDLFIRNFEFPDKVNQKSLQRQARAEEFWSMCVVANTNAGPTGSVAAAQGGIHTQSGRQINEGDERIVPSSVPQTGIISDFTSYTAFYGEWSSGTTQRRLSEIWGAQGKPNSHNVATLDGYYLVATKPKFGNVGDIISVVLDDGTYFNAIIGDQKGSDSPSEWGHYFGSQISIIEWEAYGSNQSALNSALSEAGWYGKKVSKIINYGSWLDSRG